MLQTKAAAHSATSTEAGPTAAGPPEVQANAQDGNWLALSPEARGNFSEHCTLYPGKRVVLVTVNVNYLNMFRNWLHFAQPYLQSTEQLRVVAEQPEVVAPLQDIQQTYGFDLVQPDVATQPIAASLLEGPYRSSEFVGVVGKRPDRLLDVMTAGCSVLYVDIDTAWVKDPFLSIKGNADVYVTDDLPIRGADYCTCLLYMNPSPASISFVREWAQRMGTSMDQPVFNEVLREITEHRAPASMASLTHSVLPQDQFPPGLLAMVYTTPSVWHANWREGMNNKIDFLKSVGCWNI